MSAWMGLKNNRRITELPHYAINKSVPEDSFYTNKDTAKHCYNTFLQIADKHKLNLNNYTFIEPSAGDGCFFDLLPQNRRIGLDIQSSRSDIIKADFLQWYPPSGNYIVIGNPPFGHRGAYALAFVNRAFLFAELVVFILPMSFYSNGKGTNMKRVRNAQLLHSESLKHESFRQPGNGEPVSVKTVFQVWQKGDGTAVFSDYDVSEFVDIYTVCSAPTRRCGMDKLNAYDCYIASTFYRDIHIVKTFDQVNYGSGYGIIIKRKRREVRKALENADWLKYCSDATNHCKHIRMHSIRQCLGESGFGKVLSEPKHLL